MIQKQFSLKLDIRSFFEVGRARSSPTFKMSSSSNSTSFSNQAGAGSNSRATSVSASGGIKSSSQKIFTPGATSSSGSAAANASFPHCVTVSVEAFTPPESTP